MKGFKGIIPDYQSGMTVITGISMKGRQEDQGQSRCDLRCRDQSDSRKEPQARKASSF